MFFLTLNLLLMIAEKQMIFGVSSAFENISIKFGRTQADFNGNMLHWTWNTIMAIADSATTYRRAVNFPNIYRDPHDKG